MDKEIQDMLNDLPNKKFAKLSDKKLEALENNPFKKGHSDERKKIIGQQKLGNKNCVNRVMSNETIDKIRNKLKGKINIQKNTKPIICYSYPNMEFIKEFDCLSIAAKELNINKECARLTCVGKRNHTGGYTFRYK